MTYRWDHLTEKTYESEPCPYRLRERKKLVAQEVSRTYKGHDGQIVLPYHDHSRLPASNIPQYQGDGRGSVRY